MVVKESLDFIKQFAGIDASNRYFYSPFFDSAFILISFFILSKLLVFVSTRIILRLTKKTKTDIDDLIVGRVNKPLSIILLIVGVRLALLPLGITQLYLDILEHILGTLSAIVVAYIVIVIVSIVIDNWFSKVAEKTESTLDDEIVPLVHNVLRFLIIIVSFLFILTVWGVKIGPLLASLGIVGIAVAFALQSTLGNIFGGLSIILDKSIRVGDKIKLDNDTMGTVLRIGLRSTKILSFDNEMITIPSGKLADSKILNFLQPTPTVRGVVDFGVEYGSDPEKVRKTVLDIMKKNSNVLKDPEPKVFMEEMGDFALKFKAMFWVAQFDQKFDTKSRLTEEIYKALRKEGIGIPFPTRTVYMKNKED